MVNWNGSIRVMGARGCTLRTDVFWENADEREFFYQISNFASFDVIMKIRIGIWQMTF